MIGGLDGNRMLLGLADRYRCSYFPCAEDKGAGVSGADRLYRYRGRCRGACRCRTSTLEDGTTLGIVNSITGGFGSTLGSIGIIIGFGVMMGQIFEATGAAKRMAFTFLKLFGKKREEEALCLTGFLVSIPIFCDSGFRGSFTDRQGDFQRLRRNL